MIEKIDKKQKLLISVVKKGLGTNVVEASKKMGCEGGTILPGCGTSTRDHSTFLGLSFNPEKDIIFSVLDEKIAYNALEAITKAAKLDKPGNGIAFILNLNSVTGIAHLLEPNN